MARQGIGTGSSPNDGTGDNLRTAGGKINDNFSELYGYFGDGTTLSRGTWDIVSSGINTLSSVGIGTTNPRFTLEVGAVGASGTSLYVNGDARVTGILTVGSSSVTLNGSTNEITVGTGITINGNTGIISATQVTIAGETLTGAGVTSLVAGSNITLSGSTGQVTISSSGGGGGSAGAGGTWSDYDTNTGITTTKKVKIQNNLEVTGVTTSTGGFVGNVTGNASGSSGSCSGNSATATALATARNIGGVSFNGSGDINLPGVNAAGNQDTSGTALLATNVTVSANNSTDETVYPVFVDGATGSQGAETDTGLNYNPSTGRVTAVSYAGDGSALTGLTGASAATYGSATVAPVITVDANGRVSSITTATISGGGGGGGAMEYISTTTISSATAQVEFDLSSTDYDFFIVKAYGCKFTAAPSNGYCVYFNFYDGTYNSGSPATNKLNYRYQRSQRDGSSLTTGSTYAQDLTLFLSWTPDTSTQFGFNAEVGGKTDSPVYITSNFIKGTSTSSGAPSIDGVAPNSSNNITYMIVKPSTTTFAAGKFLLYGVKNS